MEFPSPRAGRLTVAGLRKVEGPEGEAVEVSCTGPAKPSILVNVTLKTAEEPAATFNAKGVDKIPKSTTPAVTVWR